MNRACSSVYRVSQTELATLRAGGAMRVPDDLIIRCDRVRHPADEEHVGMTMLAGAPPSSAPIGVWRVWRS